VKYPKVKLYTVHWDEDYETEERRNPRVVCFEADQSEKWFLLNSDRMTADQRSAFGTTYIAKEGKVGRVAKGVGLDPIEAAYLALEKLKADEAHIERVLNSVRRELTDLAVLGLSEAKVTL
jgi:hypothetical protein